MADGDCTEKAQCVKCGASFEYVRVRKPRKYCDTCKGSKWNPYIECGHCGVTFKAGWHLQVYCSKDCKREAGRPAQSVCNTCGESFTYDPRTSSGIHCSRQCNRLPATERDPEPPSCSVVRQSKCCQCQKTFVVNGVVGEPFCGRSCKDQHRRENSKFYSRLVYGKPLSSLFICPETGVLFVPSSLNQKYASKSVTKRVKRRISKARREARIRGATALENIDPLDVLKADSYICQICGIQTDPSDRGTCKPEAPEVDHIVPLARGGTHTMDNLQCACRQCNGVKSDNVYKSAEKQWRLRL